MNTTECPKRKQLLLFDYFIYKWLYLEREGAKDDYQSRFLSYLVKKKPIIMINKLLYLLCVESTEENQMGLFATFNRWHRLVSGPVCMDVYSNRMYLYNFVLCGDGTGKQWFESNLFNGKINFSQYHGIMYPKLVMERVETEKQFIEYMEHNFSEETDSVNNTLNCLKNYKSLWQHLESGNVEEIISIVMRLPMYIRSGLSNDQELSTDNVFNFPEEKDTFHRLISEI